ncbi:glycosyltransferase [bacterium]|nr:glycosyltransferase [bacterium]
MGSSARKILMLLENNAYPQDSRVFNEANALTKAGFQISVIAQRKDKQAWTEIINGVAVYRYPAPLEADGFFAYVVEYGYSLIVMFFLSIVVLSRRGFKVIHAHNPPDVLVLIAIFYKLWGKKFVFDHHDLSAELYDAKADGEGNKTVHRTLLFFEKVSFRFADRVISTNQSYKDIAMTRGHVLEQDITIVRNGPVLENIAHVAPDAELARKIGTRIAYLGEMGLQDGLDYLIRAINHLVNDFNRKDVYVILIGSGSAVESLKALVQDLNLQEYIQFAGYQPASIWQSMLASAHIGVVPDPINPFNNQSSMIKITDYMAFSKPIVAFDLREHRVTAGPAALYAEPNNEMDFAKQIVKLMDNPELQVEMGKIGYERIVNEFAWPHQAKKLIELYQNLLG